MNKWIVYLLLIVLCPLFVFGDQQHQYLNFVSPKHVKSTRLTKRTSLKEEDPDSQIYSTITPKIHQGIWPDFCLQHLQDDPEGCSAWSEDEKGNVQLEFLLHGQSQVQIDRELINQLGHLVYLIPIKNRGKGDKKYCDHAWCPICEQTVLRAICVEQDDRYDEGYAYLYFLVHKCGCTGCWWIDLDGLDTDTKEHKIYRRWRFCKSSTIYHGYLDWHHQTYFRHLKNVLLYVEENPNCSCYWPQVDPRAQIISDLAYEKLDKIIESANEEKIFDSFSSYLVERSPHGFLTGLLAHAFFYSHYRDILLDLDQHGLNELPLDEYTLMHTQLMDVEEEIQTPLLNLYTECLQKHPHPKIYYERGMVLFHRGENLDSLDDIRKFISYAENNRYQELLTSDLYLKEGRLLSESLSYDEAIVALTKAIEKDPKNIEAYFERAIAYFEKGDFSKSLSDYLASGIHPMKIDPKKVGRFNSVTFGQGIALGMIKGGQASVTEFVPSLLSCFRGISRGIWAFVSSPIEVSQDMVDCAYACLEFVKDNTKKEILYKLAPELQECLKKWEQLDDNTKGGYIGYVVGKYGADIFIGSGSVKAIQLYRNLRKANALMTLETASISPKLTQQVLEQAVRQEKLREKILKSGNLKVQWDKQGKHIKGHKNYAPEKNKSIFTHQDPQKLINEFAGTGKMSGHQIPGKPGYKEDVNFHEIIGYAIDRDTGKKIATTWGKIHYAKDGVHIVPTKPRG
jgi:tetratricopeptide (TPR) repeat protein